MRQRKPQRPQPFYLPASNYYVLTFAIGTAVFFIVWGLLHDSGDEMPWVTAGIAFSVVIGGAVVVREVLIRRARRRFQQTKREMDNQLAEAMMKVRATERAPKLTIEQNQLLLGEIAKKSEAAKVLGKFADAHREVFELCSRYIAVAERELPQVNVGSPRLPALRKGSNKAAKIRRFHVLAWTQIETARLTQAARTTDRSVEKIASVQEAISLIDTAMMHCPDEISLDDTRSLLTEMLASVRVSHFEEKAERAIFNGQRREALAYYRDALFHLGRENHASAERDAKAEDIHKRIEKLRFEIESNS
ncbi:MAG TPA: hypothetical protein PKA82_05165 [Pyrinomonadaceae bacterium]|nr:hypothetical protein [Pyrinomonadaceae bacterium]